MALVVSIANPSEVLGWRHALLILACERAAPLFAALGVPEVIARSPQPLIDAAQEFWRLDEGLARAIATDGARTGPDERRLGTVALLNSALRALGDAYPEAALGELMAWASRSYVDEAQRADLFTWGQVLLSVVLRGATQALPPDQRTAFERAVAGRVGQAPEAADKAAVKAFEATAPSAFETRLAEHEPELHGLAVESLRETLRNQRTWQALAALAPQLADRDAFLAWARDQAKIAGIPPELLHWR